MPSCSILRAARSHRLVESLADPDIAVDLALGVHHRRGRGGDEVGLRPCAARHMFSCKAADVERCVRPNPGIDHVIDVLHGSVRAATDVFVGTQFDQLAELLRASVGRPFIFLNVRSRLFARAASSAGPAARLAL